MAGDTVGSTPVLREADRRYQQGQGKGTDPVSRIVRPGFVAADSPSDAYAPTLTAATIRRLASLSSEADRVLRAQVPGAFSEVVNINTLITRLIDTGRMYIETDGPYKQLGMHLDHRYQWEIVPGSYGIGYTLIARQAL